MSTLTKRQSQVLSAINSFSQTQGYLPSYRELIKILGMSSTATLHKHIQNLIALGHLKKLPRGARSIKSTKAQKTSNHKEIAIIGSISKGQKIEIFKEVSFFEIPKNLSSLKSTLYGFVIHDHSFSNMHMLKGDLLVIEANLEPHNGEMILAQSKASGAQIGRYLVTFNERSLESQIQEIDGKSASHSLSFEENDLRIQGVIVGLFRKYT